MNYKQNTLNNKFQKILFDQSEFKIWEHLDNGCSIATMGYSEKNTWILLKLLKSFEEQYGEEIDFNAAKKELELYQERGKLFIYLNEEGIPISMNGCIYNYNNDTVEFTKDGKPATSVYIYGLSTIKKYRGKGACSTLVKYSIDFAKENNFDIIYARTDLVGSNSEGIMKKNGMELCLSHDMIIAEWVQVTEEKGDSRLHLWKPLKSGVKMAPKGNFHYALNNSERTILQLTMPNTNKKKMNLKPQTAE